jgi:hypothetical protein
MTYDDAGEVLAETVPPVLRSRLLGATPQPSSSWAW